MTPTPSDAAALPGAVLLDMDGTLTDSEKWWFRGEAELLAEYGVEWTEELAKEVVGCPIDWWASTMVERFGLPARPEDVARDLVARVHGIVSREPAQWRPGARELLELLARLAVPSAVVTSSPQAIAPLLEDGTLLEYGCHLTIEDGPAMASHDLTRPGLIIVGDAAGFTLNTGLTIRGMDLAAGSAIAAAETIRRAFNKEDFGQEAMDAYLRLLDSGFVGKDMATYAKAPAFLERPRMYTDYGKLAAEVFYGIFNHDLKPRRHMRKVGFDALKASGLKLTHIAGDVLAGVRAL